ncbi:ATP-dependent acyl-CoA ligase [Cytobacillus oceanisediminis]
MNLRHASINEMLDHRATHDADRPFVRDRDGASRTYAETHLAVRRLAGALAGRGVRAGDTVLIMLPNGLAIVDTWLACAALGAVEVPVNVHLRGDFLRHVLEDSSARLLVVAADLFPAVVEAGLPERICDVVVVEPGDDDVVPGVALHDYAELAAAAPVPTLAPTSTGELTGIFYTSGTTGPAKGIMFTHGQGAATARNYVDATGAGPDDVFFCCMPLFHSNAQVLQVVAPMMVGAQVSIWPQFTATRWLDQVRAVGATISNTLGVMAEFLYRQPPRPDDADNPLRVLQTIPAPAGLVSRIEERFGLTCIDGYGLTDVGMIAFRRHDQPLVLGSSGRVVASDYDVVVADPETDVPVPTGRVGEILVRPRVPGAFMLGYWNRPELTSSAWRNLWFHTGDSGRFDEDGNLFFVDRLGDSIRVRGENVSSAQIEAVAVEHPAVVACAAVAVPSDVGDYDVLLVVVPAPGEHPDPVSLVRHCEGRMPYFAVPRYVDVVGELPMTATQKVRKIELRRRGVPPTAWDRTAAGVVVAR